MSFRFPSLSLAVVAAATPPHWETALCDEGFGPVDFSTDTDVVAMTAMTAQAVRAYEIADAFRSRGKTVVMGGFHASNLPDEALGQVDAVVDRTCSLKLFRGMTGMGLKWLSHASLDLAEDPELLEAAHIQAGIFLILTPYPGTKVRERLLAEDRIRDRDFDFGRRTAEGPDGSSEGPWGCAAAAQPHGRAAAKARGEPGRDSRARLALREAGPGT